MSNAVWVSDAHGDTRLIKPFDSALRFSDFERALQTARRYNRNEALAPGEFPDTYYGKYRNRRMPRQPDLFLAGGFWCVSAACADVLRRFDLRPGGLHPVRLFQNDRETPVEGEYFGLGFGAVKHALLPDQSKMDCREMSERWSLRSTAEDDDVAVTPAVLEAADLWTDPKLFLGFFVSDRLAQALKAAKVARNFRLKRCRVVQSS